MALLVKNTFSFGSQTNRSPLSGPAEDLELDRASSQIDGRVVIEQDGIPWINLMDRDVANQDVQDSGAFARSRRDHRSGRTRGRAQGLRAGPDKGRSVRLASEGEGILHQQRHSREKPAIPWLLEGNHDLALETMRKMKAFLPADTVIVPGHGRPTTIESSLDYFIAYLETLDREVRRPWPMIVLGGDVKVATAQAFSGYTLYPWIHKQMNVRMPIAG